MAKYISWDAQLKDPRWQKLRLEIMQRDGFECHDCAEKSKTLHVHHKRYEKGKRAWEYDPSNLVTLCEDCHKARHDAEESLKNAIATADDITTTVRAIGYVKGLHAFDAGENAHISIANAEEAIGVAAAFGVPWWVIEGAIGFRTSVTARSLDVLQSLYHAAFVPPVSVEEQRRRLKVLLCNIEALGGRLE